ncbi:MAG: DUF1540 domain-containing protein [Acidobacteriota bacterium]
MPNVDRCLVEECKYNRDFECNAKGIEVRAAGDRIVESSVGTCCETFKPKGNTIYTDAEEFGTMNSPIGTSL